MKLKKTKLLEDGGIHVCTNYPAVRNWIERLRKIGFNYFVIFRDTRGPALQFAKASWVPYAMGKNAIYVNG